MNEQRKKSLIFTFVALVSGIVMSTTAAQAYTEYSRLSASTCKLDTYSSSQSATLSQAGWTGTTATILCPIIDSTPFPQGTVATVYVDVDIQTSGGSFCAEICDVSNVNPSTVTCGTGTCVSTTGHSSIQPDVSALTNTSDTDYYPEIVVSMSALTSGTLLGYVAVN